MKTGTERAAKATRRPLQTLTKTRYILFNGRHHAVRLGEEEDLDKLQMEARSLHEVSGDSYRIYDTELQDNVYHWPLVVLDEIEREVG